ncbi:YHS domain-containing (seleno)protein [Patiriisocius hiemis]|uniref:YHS domain-containing (Seleno)protein n=1 Tax=Patiriisocius hiemis TaxID=3075604 RepID=A0ABU2YDX9_9FLAO|nr:YHS domain-containing (seleno)protein [Constantimarinum sp. W242]MDT0556386.1 YHS domain-containing (seleno)protein [Constantimarinum sp. W242]
MKKKILLLLFFISTIAFSQEHVNLKKGYAAEGYDVVSYFSNTAEKGDKTYTATYEGVKYKFSNNKNKKTFLENPAMYVPQYGGYCAYAIALKGDKVSVNPKTFQIIDNKLYLFYNSWGTNTLEKWNEEGAEALQKEADANWKSIVLKGN